MLAALPFPAFFVFLFAVRNLLSEGTEKKLRRFWEKVQRNLENLPRFWRNVRDFSRNVQRFLRKCRAFTDNLREMMQVKEVFKGHKARFYDEMEQNTAKGNKNPQISFQRGGAKMGRKGRTCVVYIAK